MEMVVQRSKHAFRMAALLAAVLAAALPAFTFADTFTVVNLDDSGPGSLRQAILDANANPGPDEIRFADDLEGTITLTSGELSITDDLQIEGPGENCLTVSGNNASRVFHVSGKGIEVEIRRLTIANGLATAITAVGPYGPVTLGGGVLNTAASLTLSRVTVLSNTASGDVLRGAGGGGIANVSGATLTVTYGALTNNTASGSRALGGAILNEVGSTLSVHRSTCNGNHATGTVGGQPFVDITFLGGGQGGCIANDAGYATVSQSNLESNMAQGGNGADGGPGKDGGAGGLGTGGAIRNTNYSLLVSDAGGATVDVADTTFTGNQALGGNGGNGGDNGNGGAGRNVVGGAIGASSETTQHMTTTITRSKFIGNRAICGKGGNGGAGGNGGSGIMIARGGALYTATTSTIEDSLFVDNQAIGSVGGDGGAGGKGGAGTRATGGGMAFVSGPRPPTYPYFRVARTILQNNRAIGGDGGSGVAGGDGGAGHGGGFGLEGADPRVVRACVMDSLVTNNSAIGGAGGFSDGKDGEGKGGGVWLDSTAEVGLVGTDVRDNFASTSDPDVFGDFSQECVP